MYNNKEKSLIIIIFCIISILIMIIFGIISKFIKIKKIEFKNVGSDIVENKEFRKNIK